MLFLTAVVNAGVKRISARVNALVPGFNDTEEDLRTMVDRIAKTGCKRIAMSHMYGATKVIFP